MENEGPGTVYWRFYRLVEELNKRFPGVVNPYLSDPPEPKLLKAIDELVAKTKPYKSQEQQELEARLERIDRFLSEDTPTPGSSEPK